MLLARPRRNPAREQRSPLHREVGARLREEVYCPQVDALRSLLISYAKLVDRKEFSNRVFGTLVLPLAS